MSSHLGIMAHLQQELDISAVEVQCIYLQELFSCFLQLRLRQFLCLRPEFAPALQITISAVVLGIFACRHNVIACTW